MREDVSLLGRHSFLDKYGEDMESFYDMVTSEKIRGIVKTSLINIREWKQKEKVMSRVNDWLIEMEEDAVHLSLSAWLAKHGTSRKDIWARVQKESEDQLDLLPDG
tara:strand:- start:314 stop:631 length:318 start_codon:yes stop_codon:yes gene_type:complete